MKRLELVAALLKRAQALGKAQAAYNFLENRVDLQLEYPAFVKGKFLRASVLQEAATAVGM